MAASICALCLRTVPIVSSHLLPAGVYRLLRDNGKDNPNPVVVGQMTSVQTAAQVEAPLLCSDCEQRFNNGGERWVLQNCYRGPGEFGLHDTLKMTKPLLELDRWAIHAGAGVPGIDMDALVYFAASVIWRASARSWPFHDSRDQLSLGPYAESFRLYLLGSKSFPENAAVWVNVWPAPVMLAVLPRTLAADGYRHHNFSVPGMTFHVFVGQHIPDGIRLACAARSPERMLLVSNEMNTPMLNAIRRTVLGSRARGGLRKT